MNGYDVRVLDHEVGGIEFACLGCKSKCWIPIAGSKWTAGDGWKWNGSLTHATLTPSILNNCCGWHGYLTNGEFKKA